MNLKLIIATIAILALTLVPAILDGQRRFRWGEDAEVAMLAEALHTFPKSIGQWTMVDEVVMDQVSVDQLQPIATINRIYSMTTDTDPPQKKQAHVFLLLGPTGPTAVHTPDICFSSRQYRQTGNRKPVAIGSTGSNPSICFRSEFESRDANSEYLASWFGWTTDGIWRAPARPRFEFAGSRFLFKLQVTMRYNSPEAMKNDPQMVEFLNELDRTIQKKIF